MFFGLSAIAHPCCKMQEVVESFFCESIDQATFSANLFPDWIRTTIKQTGRQVTTGNAVDGCATSSPNRTTLGDRFKAVHTQLHAGSMSSAKRRAIYDQMFATNQIEELCDGTRSLPANVIDWNSDLGLAINELMEALYNSLDLAVFRRQGQPGQPTHQLYTEFTATNYMVCPFCGLDRMKNPFGKSRGDFDHYLNRARYPLAAANLKNLIPTCDTCNKDYKKAKDILEDGMAFYPYSAIPGVRVQIDCAKYPAPGNTRDTGLWDVKIDLLVPNPKAEVKVRAWDRVYSIKKRLEDEIRQYSDDWMEEVSDSHPRPLSKQEFRELVASARSSAEARARRRMQPGQIVRAAFYEFILTKADGKFFESYLRNANDPKRSS